jgi:hypothetical protein
VVGTRDYEGKREMFLCLSPTCQELEWRMFRERRDKQQRAKNGSYLRFGDVKRRQFFVTAFLILSVEEAHWEYFHGPGALSHVFVEQQRRA